MKIKSPSNTKPRTANAAAICRQNARRCVVPRSLFGVRRSPARLLPAQRGVALVITIIMLAVVLFMAITFLAVSRRERNAVTTTTDTATAKLAADDALASAEAQIMANTLATTNPYNFGLQVSTDYVNHLGFTPGSVSPTNVNYEYLTPAAGGGPLTENDFLQNLANLQYLPRPPVFYQTNASPKAPLDFRFYLDLNRNGVFDPNNFAPGAYTAGAGPVGDPEWIGILQHPGQPYGPNNPFVARFAFLALPIGNALDLNAIYNQAATREVNPLSAGADGFMRNQGVGSWEINLAAFLTDLNYNEWDPIQNPYKYLEWQAPPNNHINTGAGFEDALSLLSYRYSYNYYSLAPVGGSNPNGLFTRANTLLPFQNNIDYYSDGPLMTTPAGIYDGTQPITLPWSGAENTNHFFDLQELYNTNLFPTLASHLQAIGDAFNPNNNPNNNDPTNFYNRYTYYRLLAQMGVASAPEQDKINLNYSNAFAYFDNNGVLTNIAFYPNAQTNLTPWQPLQFFTIAADRMLRAYSQEWLTASPSNYMATYGVTTNIGTLAYPTNMPIPFGISDIPVVISNRFVYTPAIQRVLQLAANIYDATTNTGTLSTPDYPSVFRPIFRVTYDPASGYTNVYVAGYEPVEYNGQMGAVDPNLNADPQLRLPVTVADLLNPNYTYNLSPSGHLGLGLYTSINVYGVPWIIGAKKGFPNFNEFALQSVFQLTRKLEVTRPSTNSPMSDYEYNQMFNLSLSNQVAVECWNSYTNSYGYGYPNGRSVAMYVSDALSVALTNDETINGRPFIYKNNFLLADNLQIYPTNPTLTNRDWPGYNPKVDPLGSLQSFKIPLNTNTPVIPTSMYRFNLGGSGPYLTTNLDWPYERNVVVDGIKYPQPHWWLLTTNNVRAFILDTTGPGAPRIIDYVQLRGPDSVRDLTSEIIKNYDTGSPSRNQGDDLWDTNRNNLGIPYGIANLLAVCWGNATPGAGSGKWNSSGTERENEIDGFRAFFAPLHMRPLYPANPGESRAVAEASMTNAIQAPYTPTATVVQHFSWQANDPLVHYLASDLSWPGGDRIDRSVDNPPNSNIGKLNQRYMPWGGNPLLSGEDKNPYNLALKDPLVWRSDDWDFPTYKFPTVGWLGRVHRGTPWQTVYLKSPDILREIQRSGSAHTTDIGTNTWVAWTGANRLTHGQYYDAANMAPVQDRLLFDLFSTAPDANATRGQLSVNVGAAHPSPQAGLAAWSALFSGVQVLSNNVAYPFNQHNGSLVDYTNFPIAPAGPQGTNSALGQIVAGINQARVNGFNTARIIADNKTGTATNEIPASFVNPDGLRNAFEHVGDILSVPQLSDESPFLNWNNLTQLKGGISDEMYEWLPQQVMSLLRVSGTPQSPMRYVIYCYGQALKPAQGAIYTGGGPYFGMVTNYQVVAESATRSVVSFGSIVTNSVSTNDVNGFIHLLPHGVPMVTNNTVQLVEPPVPLPPD